MLDPVYCTLFIYSYLVYISVYFEGSVQDGIVLFSVTPLLN